MNLNLQKELVEKKLQAEITQKSVEEEQKVAEIKRNEIKMLTDSCKTEYDAALPILQAAHEAIMKIDKI